MSMKVSSARSHSPSKKAESSGGPDKGAEAKRVDARPHQPKEVKAEKKTESPPKQWQDGWDASAPGTCQPGNATHQVTNRGRGGDSTVNVNYVPGQDGCCEASDTTLITNRGRGGDSTVNVNYVPGQDGSNGVCPAPGQQQPPSPWMPPVYNA